MHVPNLSFRRRTMIKRQVNRSNRLKLRVKCMRRPLPKRLHSSHSNRTIIISNSSNNSFRHHNNHCNKPLSHRRILMHRNDQTQDPGQGRAKRIVHELIRNRAIVRAHARQSNTAAAVRNDRRDTRNRRRCRLRGIRKNGTYSYPCHSLSYFTEHIELTSVSHFQRSQKSRP